jgi:hypothetical protein
MLDSEIFRELSFASTDPLSLTTPPLPSTVMKLPGMDTAGSHASPKHRRHAVFPRHDGTVTQRAAHNRNIAYEPRVYGMIAYKC